MPKAVAITHAPFEDLGPLAAVLAERNYAVQTAARRFWRCWLGAAG